MKEKDLSQIGSDILLASRNELYMNFPYMSTALCSLLFCSGDDKTVSAATDGETLFYNCNFIAERYLRGTVQINRLYLHIIFHCLLRHPFKKKGHNSVLWDLACDAAVESILDSLNYRCLSEHTSILRSKFYSECSSEMKVLTAEAIYRKLLRDRRSEFELAKLQREFLCDDHGLWDPSDNEGRDRSDRQDKRWKEQAENSKTAMETLLSERADGGDTILEQLRVSARDDIDYRAFLRRFAAPREILAVDDDAFDYIYYTYGLGRYRNMPLIEPPETREEKRIEDLVIAIDTSMSTNGELVREFLQCTYSILRSTETFTRRLCIHILQCDNQVRSDKLITTMSELAEYMNDLPLSGGSSTDFRPVFEYISSLQKKGEFSSLRGLIFFTDGMGIYPQKRPPYETAFVLLEEPPLAYKMPPWCIKLLLSLPALEKACSFQETEPAYDSLDELPEL